MTLANMQGHFDARNFFCKIKINLSNTAKVEVVSGYLYRIVPKLAQLTSAKIFNRVC